MAVLPFVTKIPNKLQKTDYVAYSQIPNKLQKKIDFKRHMYHRLPIFCAKEKNNQVKYVINHL